MFGPKNNGAPAQTGSTQKLNLVIIAAVSFIALVILIAWVALGMVQEKIQHDTGDALQTVLQTTQESLTLWAENKKYQLTKLAADPHVVSLVEDLLQTPRDKDALSKSLSNWSSWIGKCRKWTVSNLPSALKIIPRSTKFRPLSW